jgi:hypothetical protein
LFRTLIIIVYVQLCHRRRRRLVDAQKNKNINVSDGGFNSTADVNAKIETLFGGRFMIVF